MNQNIKIQNSVSVTIKVYLNLYVNYKILDELNFFHLKFSEFFINGSIVPLWWNLSRRNPVSTILYHID